MIFKYQLEHGFLIKPYRVVILHLEIPHLLIKLPQRSVLLSPLCSMNFLFSLQLFSCLVPSLDCKLLECRNQTLFNSLSLHYLEESTKVIEKNDCRK